MSEEKEKIVAVLDFRGKECFEMRLDIRAKINQMAVGEIIKIITDNPKSIKTLPKWIVLNEQELFLSDTTGSEYIYYIRKLVQLP